jgi:hypothetical protein
MASEIHTFACTIPAGTPASAPATFPLTMPQRVVTAVEVKVPPGPRGLMGFRLGSTGNQLIPAIVGSWLIVDNYDQVWPLENMIDSGSWEAFGYNTGNYPHTVTFVFFCTVPGIAAPSTPSLIDLSTLTSS